jgi:RNA polymerase sigma-70 factor (ECF subfamily)
MLTDSELALVVRIRRRDAVALADYLQRHRAQLIAVVRSRMSIQLLAKVDAEDIVHEVSVQAVEGLAQVDLEDGDPWPWLLQIAEHRIIDARRRYAAQKRDVMREVGLFSGGTSDGGEAGLVRVLVASITSPSKAFSRMQRERQMMDAFAHLPPLQQQVLTLRFIEGLPSKEIAQRIAKSDGATRVMISRALRRLQHALQAQATSSSP